MAKNQTEVLKSMREALVEIKQVTNTGAPTSVSVSKILTDHKVNSYMLAALKDLDVIKHERDGGKSLYQWNLGAASIDDVLLDKIYELIKIKHAAPKQARKDGNQDKYKVNAPPLDFEALKKMRSEKPLSPATPKKEEKKVRNTRNAPSVNAQPVRQDRKAQERIAKEMGVIFGYKQLDYLRESLFSLPHEVSIHGLTSPSSAAVLIGVKAIRYKVEGSDLAVTFFSDNNPEVLDVTPELCTLFQLRIKNTVLGFRRGGGDSQMLILHLTLVTVKDPYQIS